MVKTGRVQTAYGETAALEYDRRRFTSPSGLLFHKLEEQQLKAVLRKLSDKSSVLEVGCGTGRFAETVIKANQDICCVEPSPHMIDIARNRYIELKKAPFLEAEGARLPFTSQTFDFTYSIRVLNQTESESYALEMVREMARVTKPGGKVLVEFCNKWRPRKAGKQAVRLTVPEVLLALKSQSRLAEHRATGILFLSETLLHKIPPRLLGIYMRFDQFLCRIWPQFAARCYISAEISC